MIPIGGPLNGLSDEHWAEEVHLKQAGAGAPDVEVAVAAGFNEEEYQDNQSCQGEWHGAVVGVAEGDGQGNASNGHCPVGGCVQALAPDFAPIHLSPVEVGQCTQFGGTEFGLI